MLSALMVPKLPIKDKDYFAYDNDGLMLRIRPSGRRIWYVRYTENGSRRLVRVGEYPMMTLIQARDARDQLKQRVRSGAPAVDQSQQTFADLSAEWMSVFKTGKAETHIRTVRYRLAHYILPVIGRMQIGEIRRIDLTSLLLRIAVNGHIETAKRCAGIINQIFSYAVNRGIIESHPAVGLTAVLPHHTVEHFASIADPQQLGRLIWAIDTINAPITRAALRLLAYCFPRIGELLLATWSEFDLAGALWSIPAVHTKRRRDHLVPLPSQIAVMMHQLYEYEAAAVYGGSPMADLLVFPTMFPRQGRRGTVSLTEAALRLELRRLCTRLKIEVTTPHGFRHTASTLLYARGENSQWIEEQLSHLDPNRIRAVYNRYDFLPERREMLQRYADYLDALRDGTPVPEKHA